MAAVSPDSLMPPLVVRNKRGRKVDETLPKSHQREVQRQFRARRAGHLLDLERRVSILERENLILRHWAGVHPANRYLLGRGPTGCDTTKPLIADENDPELQLVIDESAPQDRSWDSMPQAAPARPPYIPEQQEGMAPMSASQSTPPQQQHLQLHQLQQQQQQQQQQQVHPNPPIAPTAPPPLEKSGYDQSPYPDAHKYKPHPLYDQRPLFADHPAHVSSYEQNPPALAAERLLVKRESIYQPPSGLAVPSLLSQTQRTDVPASDSSAYYFPPRPSYSRPADTQPVSSGHHGDVGGGASNGPPTSHQMYPAHLVSWPDPYASGSGPTSVSQILNRRPQPPNGLTPLTPVLPPVGLTSGSLSTPSPSSQPSSASGSGGEQRNPSDSMYGSRRSVTYGSGFNSNNVTPTSSSAMYLHHTSSQMQYPSHLEASHASSQQQQHAHQYLDASAPSESFRQ